MSDPAANFTPDFSTRCTRAGNSVALPRSSTRASADACACTCAGAPGAVLRASAQNRDANSCTERVMGQSLSAIA